MLNLIFFLAIIPLNDNDAVSWLSGKRLRVEAQAEIKGAWESAPIRSMLSQLAATKRIPLFIDRRVDPTIKIDFIAESVNWEQLLLEIGGPYQLGFCKLDEIYYFGPERTAISLPQQYEKLKKWANRNRKNAKVAWNQSSDLAWAELSQPAEMLKALAKRNKIELSGIRLPLDLWPKSELPKKSMLLKAVLLSVGFDCWPLISVSGSKMKIVEFNQLKVIEFSIIDGNRNNSVNEWNRRFPQIQFKSSGRYLKLTGKPDDVAKAVTAIIKAQKVTTAQAQSTQAFTAQFKGKRGSIAATIANQLNLKLKFDPEIRTPLEQFVEFDVVNEPAESIMKRTLEGTDLKFRIEKDQLLIFQ